MEYLRWRVPGVWVEGERAGLDTSYEKIGSITMATTGELRAIIQELQLVDIGDAASYLGEEMKMVEEESTIQVESLLALATVTEQLASCKGCVCQAQ